MRNYLFILKSSWRRPSEGWSIYLYWKKSICYLEFKLDWASCISFAKSGSLTNEARCPCLALLGCTLTAKPRACPPFSRCSVIVLCKRIICLFSTVLFPHLTLIYQNFPHSLKILVKDIWGKCIFNTIILSFFVFHFCKTGIILSSSTLFWELELMGVKFSTMPGPPEHAKNFSSFLHEARWTILAESKNAGLGSTGGGWENG